LREEFQTALTVCACMYHGWNFFNGTKQRFPQSRFSPVECPRFKSFREPSGKRLRTHPGKSAGDYIATDSDRAALIGWDIPCFLEMPYTRNCRTQGILRNLFWVIVIVWQRCCGLFLIWSAEPVPIEGISREMCGN